MLSQSHPAYLSQLRNTVSRTKFGTDKALMMLTIVSIGVLCIQSLIGMLLLSCLHSGLTEHLQVCFP